MDWQMIGAIGEILGAGGVIVTLGYLAAQVRASGRAAQQRSAAEILDQSQHLIGLVSKDTESARIWRRGMLLADPDLTDDETSRFQSQVYAMAMLWQRFYYLMKTSELEDWLLESHQPFRRDMVHAPGFKRWFAVRSHWLTTEFREVLEREMEGPGTYIPAGPATLDAGGVGPGTT